jgi:hypothetical protein
MNGVADVVGDWVQRNVRPFVGEQIVIFASTAETLRDSEELRPPVALSPRRAGRAICADLAKGVTPDQIVATLMDEEAANGGLGSARKLLLLGPRFAQYFALWNQ